MILLELTSYLYILSVLTWMKPYQLKMLVIKQGRFVFIIIPKYFIYFDGLPKNECNIYVISGRDFGSATVVFINNIWTKNWVWSINWHFSTSYSSSKHKFNKWLTSKMPSLLAKSISNLYTELWHLERMTEKFVRRLVFIFQLLPIRYKITLGCFMFSYLLNKLKSISCL